MIAVHSNWTGPFYAINPIETEYFIEDYELVTTILSALKWRQFNGSIRMITDKIGAKYYKKLGITDIWDLGVTGNINIDSYVDPSLFWAIAKEYALKIQVSPCVSMDTDFIVKEKIEDEWWDNKIVAILPEDQTYTKPFNLKQGYSLDDELDWGIRSVNAGLIYFNDGQFLEMYLNQVMDFIKNTESDNIREEVMVFADQHLLCMCAKKMGIEMKTFMGDINPKKQKRFSHICAYKKILKKDNIARSNFCKSFLNIILTDFPERRDMIYNIEMFRKYLP